LRRGFQCQKKASLAIPKVKEEKGEKPLLGWRGKKRGTLLPYLIFGGIGGKRNTDDREREAYIRLAKEKKKRKGSGSTLLEGKDDLFTPQDES